MWRTADEEVTTDGRPAVLSIGEVASLTGVSRAVLRLWERERLISPRRSPGGHRLYSADDLGRLRQIALLRRLDRLNAAAIRRELGTAESADAPEPDEGEPALGPRLRALRVERGWSLAEVAAKAGLSVSFLSAVERGLSASRSATCSNSPTPSGRPYRGSPRDNRTWGGACCGRRSAPATWRAGPGDHRGSRRGAGGAGGAADRDPAGRRQRGLLFPPRRGVRLRAGGAAPVLDRGDRDHRLEAGDSLSFRSTRPHRWRNEGSVRRRCSGSTSRSWRGRRLGRSGPSRRGGGSGSGPRRRQRPTETGNNRAFLRRRRSGSTPSRTRRGLPHLDHRRDPVCLPLSINSRSVPQMSTRRTLTST
jgi:DNA-binding transcriptional MerR regulator